MTLIVASGLLMPVSAQAVPVAELVHTSATWLQHNGFPVDNSSAVQVVDSFLEVDEKSMKNEDYLTAAYAMPGKIVFGPASGWQVQKLAWQYGKRKKKLDDEQVYGAHVLLHEVIHSIGFKVWYNEHVTDVDRFYEEGIVDQVSADLMPAYLKQIFNFKVKGVQHSTISYKAEARQVRILSVFGSGAKNYKAYAARKWRVKFLLSDLDTRRQMVYDAHYASMR